MSNQKRRRMFIQAHLAIACKPCLKSVRYLVLLFLVWKLYWNMAASTLLRFCRSANGMDSTLRLTSALPTCSFLKYLYDFLPSVFSRTIFHSSGFTWIAVLISPVVLSVTSNVWSSFRFRSKREGFPCKPPEINSRLQNVKERMYVKLLTRTLFQVDSSFYLVEQPINRLVGT